MLYSLLVLSFVKGSKKMVFKTLNCDFLWCAGTQRWLLKIYGYMWYVDVHWSLRRIWVMKTCCISDFHFLKSAFAIHLFDICCSFHLFIFSFFFLLTTGSKYNQVRFVETHTSYFAQKIFFLCNFHCCTSTKDNKFHVLSHDEYKN